MERLGRTVLTGLLMMWLAACGGNGSAPPQSQSADKTSGADVSKALLPVTRRFVLCDAFCGVVDEQGTPTLGRLFKKISQASTQVIVYNTDITSYGAMSIRGKPIVPPTFLLLKLSADGHFLVGKRDTSQGRRKQVLNLDGKLVIDRVADVSDVGVWQGHPYYIEFDGKGRQHQVFTDKNGKPIAQFARVDVDHGLPAVASKDGHTVGYINAALEFVVAPQYRAAGVFGSKDFARVATAKGTGLIDRTGRYVVPIGDYKRIIFSPSHLFVMTRRVRGARLALYDRQGTRVHLPAGLSLVVGYSHHRYGYARVKGANGYGAVDGKGRLLVAAKYAQLTPLDSEHLAYARTPYSFVGIMSRDGVSTAKPRWREVKKGPGNAFWGRTQAGWWLIDA